VESCSCKLSEALGLHAVDEFGVVMAVISPLVLPEEVGVVIELALWRPVILHLVMELGVGLDDFDVEKAVGLLGPGVGPQSVDGEGLAG
jgi:hypothetical protein